MGLDAHEKPSDSLKRLFKHYQTVSKGATEDLCRLLHHDQGILDFTRGLNESQKVRVEAQLFRSSEDLHSHYEEYLTGERPTQAGLHQPPPVSYCHRDFPGLAVIPSLISEDVQKEILNRTFHRDLSNPSHKTNVHFHHCLDYPKEERSFFHHGPNALNVVLPKDDNSHKPMSMGQFLSKKLRWITFGGQYDWTNKVYPHGTTPAFPADLYCLLKGLFPHTDAEAAIVNLYSGNDVLSLHRDVSEFCDNGLISVSIGCDGLFIVALADESVPGAQEKHLVIRLRSGDVVYMSGPSRYAWHGIPRIVPGTCSEQLRHWPVDISDPEISSQWDGWMASKRVNLNVRQMWSHKSNGI